MKPVRGSQRPQSKPPKGRKPPKKTEKTSQQQNNPLKPGTSHQSKRAKSHKNEVSRKIKGQANWKPMSKSSITALENMLDISILSVLAVRRTEKEETQKHLNLLKKRFLASCAELPVPVQKQGSVVQKQGSVVHVSRQHQQEKKKIAVGKKALAKLEEDMAAVVSTLEQMEEQATSLSHECTDLRRQLDEEEESAREVLLLSQQGVLNLAPLPPYKDGKPTLQDQLVGLVPEADRCAVARRLGAALQKAPLQNATALVTHAHAHADRLLAPPPSP